MYDLKFLNIDIEDKRVNLVFIFFISIAVFGAYLLRLYTLISQPGSISFGTSEFIRLFNAILAMLAVFSCLLCYSSNKNENLFLISLMYVVFLCDICISNIINSHSSNIDSYLAMGTSSIRIILAIIAVSSDNFLKRLIINNKLKSLLIILLFTLLVTFIEYNLNIIGYVISGHFFMIYHIFLFLVYLIISNMFFIKSIVIKEYIYCVIGFSILMFSAKAIYSIANGVSKSTEIGLTSVSMTYISFLIFILGLFFELLKNLKRNKYLDKERSLFYNIIEENPYSNIIICDDSYNILYANKKSKEMLAEFNYLSTCDNGIDSKFDIKKLYPDELKYVEFQKHIKNYGKHSESICIDDLDMIIDFSIHTFEKYDGKYKVIRFQDISKRYEMEKALLEYENSKKEENMKNEFFANISHELKTPLNIIYSTMQLLTFSVEKDNFKDLYLKYKNSLDINCKRMLRLIDNIVDTTKLEVGFKVAEFNNYDIVSLIEGISTSVIVYARTKNIDIIFDTDVEELDIKCDPDMIERVMLNLLSNAIKFTKCGGTVLVDIISDDKFVNISVTDNGIGIPIDIQPRIFNRFVQSDKSLIRKTEGSGIGLSIVKSLVELLGGKIHLESDGVSGSKFIVSLPNEKIDLHHDKLVYKDYNIDIEKIKLEFSDIYELYDM